VGGSGGETVWSTALAERIWKDAADEDDSDQ
jgi:hypothetical protein